METLRYVGLIFHFCDFYYRFFYLFWMWYTIIEYVALSSVDKINHIDKSSSLEIILVIIIVLLNGIKRFHKKNHPHDT
jgi:hypothetical protein